jgi:hypothetical protein
MEIKSTISTICLLTLALTSCRYSGTELPEPSHPFVGCWENESGLSREGWTIDPSGWLIGYAATRDEDNNVTFFEHMRVERSADEEVLVVSGGNDNTAVRFTREKTDNPTVFKFVNATHDYPQVITYTAGNGRLDATISLVDGTNERAFLKAACQ